MIWSLGALTSTGGIHEKMMSTLMKSALPSSDSTADRWSLRTVLSDTVLVISLPAFLNKDSNVSRTVIGATKSLREFVNMYCTPKKEFCQ